MGLRSWLAAFGLWTLFGLWSLNGNQLLEISAGRPVHWGGPVRLYLASAWQWALFTPAIVLLARRVRFEREHLLRAVAVHAVACLVVAALDARIDTLLFHRLTGYPPRRFVPQVIQQANSNIFTYLVIVAATNAFDYARAFRERAVRAAELQAQLARAQLDALRAQLHPHFLFNTLHAISALMHRDVHAADRMLAQLSDLLRLAIDGVGVQEVPLLAEMEFVGRYLEIESTRLGDRLTVEVDVAAETYDALVPHLILQPLVENAVKHGVAPREEPGRITLRAAREGRELVLSVRDDGPGLSPVLVGAGRDEGSDDAQSLPRPRPRPRAERGGGGRRGVGLPNTRERLERLYGAAHRFELRAPEGGGLEVVIALPFRTAAAAPSVADGRTDAA